MPLIVKEIVAMEGFFHVITGRGTFWHGGDERKRVKKWTGGERRERRTRRRESGNGKVRCKNKRKEIKGDARGEWRRWGG